MRKARHCRGAIDMLSTYMENTTVSISNRHSSARNVRQVEESGPFGRNRSVRLGSRASRTRTGTTPVRQKENTAVADFGRLLAKEQAKDEEKRPLQSAVTNDASRVEPEVVATECVLYGYGSKSVEWKVLSKFEKIVAPSIICEDYPREDPNLLMTNSPSSFSRASVVVHKSLSRDALRKSRVYKGGQHWIKITFDSYQAAERACHYSPVDIDGYMVHCEMWQGRPPLDSALPKEAESVLRGGISRTMSAAQSSQFLSGKDTALAGFERAMTLPRSAALPDIQYGQPQDDMSVTSTTASSATATDVAPSSLRSRSVPQLPSQATQQVTSQYMTHIPSVKKVVLRPVSEALPPQAPLYEKVLRVLPVVNWFFGSSSPSEDVFGEGPAMKEDGTWDERNGWYWSFWYSIDRIFGTDLCGIKDD